MHHRTSRVSPHAEGVVEEAGWTEACERLRRGKCMVVCIPLPPEMLATLRPKGTEKGMLCVLAGHLQEPTDGRIVYWPLVLSRILGVIKKEKVEKVSLELVLLADPAPRTLPSPTTTFQKVHPIPNIFHPSIND
ncbi:hypothetical protein Pcinc_018991 [Petrolisthes cinctipes]|uniref:Uncharacterized protein n=1 Tax=Petrolisthes cinctipes TaxID=88211 RepID=A0AAE1FL13_PETCI|nr:hypothetical protein Pcinc_018991 [Petrolisthes cinctipes]